MERQDEGLPFLLKYENVAWFENGTVRILDRRIYPTEIKFVTCHAYSEVAKAISDMVTQSAGPYTAAGMGMALAAHEVRNRPYSEQIEYLKKAAHDISHARPTTANRYGIITSGCLDEAVKALDEGRNASEAIFERTIASLNRRYSTMEKAAAYLAGQIPSRGSILTQCFGETIIGMLCRVAIRKKLEFKAYCCETRPYFQGSRLTASCFYEMGFDTTVITDNMAAYTFERKGIDLFTSAADTIAMDGHIANKIGTLQLAILAKHFGAPYYVTGIPDADKASGRDIVIEERHPSLVLSYRGIKNALDGVNALYPSFDITPPHLISGVVTDKGIYSAYDLKSYFSSEVSEFY